MMHAKRLLALALAAGLLGAPAPARAAEPAKNYGELIEVSNDFYWLGGSESNIRFEQNGKYGVKTMEGKIVLPAEYESIGGWGDEAMLPVSQNGLKGAADYNGKLLIEPQYKNIEIGADTAVLQTTDDKYGFADLSGKVFIEPQYDAAEPFEGECARVAKDFRYSYIDRAGKLLVPWQDTAIETEDGVYFSAAFWEKDSMVLDRTGKTVIPSGAYDGQVAFYGGKIATAKKAGKAGLINAQGKTVVPFAFESISAWHRDWAQDGIIFVANHGGRLSYFDTDGKLLGGRDWEDMGESPLGVISPLAGNTILIRENGKYGFMNARGEILVQPRYDSIYDYGSDVNQPFFVIKDGKYGLVDKEGRLLVEPKWLLDNAGIRGFSRNGYCSVRKNGKEGILNSRGELIVAPDAFIQADYLDGGYFFFLVAENGDRSRQKEYLAKAVSPFTALDDSVLLPEAYADNAAVSELVEKGILKGDANGDLNLGGYVTRAEFVTMLSRAEGWELPENAGTGFSDVPMTHWASAAVAEAVKRGVVSGVGNGCFDPEGYVTPGQSFIVFTRLLDLEEEAKQCAENTGRNGYSEVICQLGIQDTVNSGGYSLSGPARRDLVAELLYNYLHADRTKRIEIPPKTAPEYVPMVE